MEQRSKVLVDALRMRPQRLGNQGSGEIPQQETPVVELLALGFGYTEQTSVRVALEGLIELRD
jgi:hypothetical protein